jgi:glycosyltransferase involved in cell wall biosynthesis
MELADNQMEVVYFSRKSDVSGYSIEELFETIKVHLPTDVKIRTETLPYPSKGIARRLFNMWYAYKKRGKINHITGDVHYLGIILPAKSTVLTVHDCGELNKLNGIKRFFLWLFWFYLPIKHLKYITAISETTKIELIKNVSCASGKVVVIHNCLVGFYKRKVNFNWNHPRLLQIGITSNKNIERILLALKNISCKLVILGKPTPRQLILLNESGIEYELHYHLSRTDVASLYYSCDMLVYPSTVEGFGLPIIEAQATGIPVLTSNLSSMPEIAGDGAIYVDPYNVELMRMKILKIINSGNNQQDLIDKGFNNLKRFDPKQIAQQYYHLYKKILNG